jgi:octaprenyl-diphosphate synthase
MEHSVKQPTQLPGNSAFHKIVEPHRTAFDALGAFLSSQITAFEPEVQPLVEYCFSHSGKKLRPLLVFLMGMDKQQDSDNDIIKAAAIVELVHLATLVHDDILDDADLRHRTETVVNKYGPHVAVLLGDALFSHALHLAAQFPDVSVCRAVSLATRQVCSGEIAQTFARGDQAPDTESYYRMIDLKTAELFKVSAYLGGLLAGFDHSAIDAAGDYARHLGIAYQIYDDAADIFAKESVAGKTLGTDLATGKFTLPVLIWLNQLSVRERAFALKSLRSPDQGGTDLQEQLLESGVLEKTGEAFYAQIKFARDAIDGIPGEYRKQNLEQLAAFVAGAWNKFSIR